MRREKTKQPSVPSTVTESRALTERQRRFVLEYMASGNGADAARRAGYSQRCAKEQASENLTKPNVKIEIDRRTAEMSKETVDRRSLWIDELELLAKGSDKDSDRLRAIEALFKAEGWLAPEKQEVTQFSSTFLADLDLEQEEKPNEINELH